LRRSRVLAVGAAVVLAFGLGAALHPLRAHRPVERRASLVAEVRRQLETRYYRRVPARVLDRRSVPAMLAALRDPYTRYLGADELRLARRATREGYSGVGLTLLPGEDGLLVTRTQPGPAKLAGIRPGDTILAVDGADVSGLSFDEALGRIVGRAGSSVRLRVRRAHHTLSYSLVRERFLRPSVHARMVRPGVGLIRIDRFSLRTTARTRAAALQLERRGAQGLVIDLRGNPGGLLTQATGVCSIFLEDGATIASLHGAHRRDRLLFARGGPKSRLPLAVLVDGESASAAEIVAAALRDHGRAVIVGRPTFGKSLVQEIVTLPSGDALKLTVASYLTPSGKDISAGGVRPDVRSAHALAVALRILSVAT
jgi:carboxyl-terminal processing protease